MSAASSISLEQAGPATLRVLFVIPGQETGTGNSMIFARRQADTVATLHADVESFFLRSRTSPPALFDELLRFRRRLRTFRPHVIHAQFGTMTAFFAAVGAGLGARRIPLVVTYRGSDLNPVPGSSGLRAVLGRLLSQLAAARCRRIVCVSRQLRERLWWNRNRATVLPSGVDPQRFRPEARSSARRRLGWNENVRIVLFNAGQDPRNKRLDLARAAVEEARLALPGLRLEVLDGHVDPDSIPVMMNGADCLLLTSDFEGSPSVVQEALATNLPIVSVDVGDVRDRLQGVRHTRVAERDPGVLAAALLELVRHPLRTNGREQIEEFSSQRIAHALCRMYREVAGARPPDWSS